MLKYFTCLLFGILNFSVSHTQDLMLDLRGKKLSDFISAETNLGDEKIENTSTYISGVGVAQPVRYKKKEQILPDLVISCFYFSADSAIKEIDYEWEFDNNSNREKESVVASPEIIRALKGKYEELYAVVSKKYGKGEAGHYEHNDTTDIQSDHFKLEQDDQWKLNGSIDVDLQLYLSNKFEKHVNYTIGTGYKIRLYIKNPTTSGKSTEASLLNTTLLDSVLYIFVTDLKNKDFNKAKLCLSAEAAGKVTDAQLEELSTAFKDGDSLLVYLSGMQISPTGAGYRMLQYRFKSDLNSPPRELIKVFFDDKNKILGLRQMKMQSY